MEDNVLPDEIYLRIFSTLSLVGLIHARGVCSKWQMMVYQANVSPLRLAFLKFYLETIDDPAFLSSRPWVLENLVDFDRAAFIARLESSGFQYIPEDFKMWIMEWPAKAVTGGVWPGLPRRFQTLLSRGGNEPHLEDATNLLSIAGYPKHTPYHLEILPSSFGPLGDEMNPLPIDVKVLRMFKLYGDKHTGSLGTDPHPFVKDKIVPFVTDAHSIRFLQEYFGLNPARSRRTTNAMTAAMGVIEWLKNPLWHLFQPREPEKPEGGM